MDMPLLSLRKILTAACSFWHGMLKSTERPEEATGEGQTALCALIQNSPSWGAESGLGAVSMLSMHPGLGYGFCSLLI